MTAFGFEELFEFKSKEARDLFVYGYIMAFSIGRYDGESRETMLEKFKTSLRKMRKAHELEPANPHIMMQLVWQYEYGYSEPEMMIRVIDYAIKLYSRAKIMNDYTYLDHNVDLLIWAKNDYMKELFNLSPKRKYGFLCDESDRWYE